MAMLVNSIEEFVKYVPTARGTDWAPLNPYMEEADFEMEIFSFGKDLLDAIKALDETNQIRKIACKIHCLLGYHHAIPFTDLIQTETGFAVTNTQNLAPASKERVERLIIWCVDQIDVLTDMLTEAIRGNNTLLTEWKKFGGYKQIFDCLFLSGNDFAKWAKIEGRKRAAFLNAKPDIVTLQLNLLAPVISKKYLSEIIEMLQNSAITEDAKPVITLCKQVLGQVYNKNQDEATKTLNEITNLLESDSSKYSVYFASPEYSLRHSANYVNNQADPIYFFGI
jgi:hypothetical protein